MEYVWLITAFVAWYNAYAGIANPQNSYITVKAIPLPDLQDPTRKKNKIIGQVNQSIQSINQYWFFFFNNEDLIFYLFI